MNLAFRAISFGLRKKAYYRQLWDVYDVRKGKIELLLEEEYKMLSSVIWNKHKWNCIFLSCSLHCIISSFHLFYGSYLLIGTSYLFSSFPFPVAGYALSFYIVAIEFNMTLSDRRVAKESNLKWANIFFSRLNRHIPDLVVAVVFLFMFSQFLKRKE